MDEKQTAAQPHGCFFCDIAGPQLSAFLDRMWPEHTKEHFRNARIEVLKGIRSVLDTRIEHLSQHEQRGTKVTVE
jgi:hypothetical protein